MKKGPKAEQGTLLLVDDNEMNRDVLSRRLTRHGYTVVLAAGGKEALGLIEKQRFDLALFDIMMPEVSGLDALEIVRKTHTLADLPIIMVTARNASEDVVEALQRGANDFVTKPVDFPVLLARVQTHLALNRLSRLKDEFMHMASHDLKNPLTEVLGVAALVEMMVPPGTPMPEKMYELIANLKKSAKRMQFIIEDFLDFHALEDGVLKLTVAPIDLEALAKDAVSGTVAYASDKGITLDTHFEASLPPIEGDGNRITQVIQNFVDNALKYAPRGSHVVVRTRLEGKDAVLEVEDDGPGIPLDGIDRVFVKYAMIGNAPTGGEKSSGLGLAICKQLVDRHHGKIGVRNNPAAGVTFWFTLPTATGDQAP